jgi:hypothetical protein
MGITKYLNPLTYVKPIVIVGAVGSAAVGGWFANDFYRNKVKPFMNENEPQITEIKEGGVEIAQKGKEGCDALVKEYHRIKAILESREKKKQTDGKKMTLSGTMAANE